MAAVAAPLLAELVPNGLMPPVVLEVLAGVVLGPQVAGWLHVDFPVKLLSLLGLGFLLFLAGMELTPSSLWSRSATNRHNRLHRLRGARVSIGPGPQGCGR